MICYLFEPPSYLIFSADLPELLYYTHIPATILALLVGLFVFLNKRHELLNILLFLISITFSVWTFNSLLGWTNIHANFLAFLWPVYGISAALLSILSIYFIYVFLDKKDVRFRNKIIFFVLLLPVLLFAHTDLSLSGFNISDCDAFGYEGLLYKSYYTILGFVAMIWIGALLIHRYRRAEKNFKKQIILMGIGIELFLFSFITMTFVASYLTSVGLLEDSSLEWYGLFGMTFFMIMIGVLIVRFKTFHVGVLTAQALLVAMVILVGSQFTFSTSVTTTILTAVTLLLTAITGILLNRSVKKEIAQRKQLEQLTEKLERANERLKELDKLKSEFVSIASHQLRSPLTSIRGYASMLTEGSFGKLPKKAEESANRIAESARLMAMAVEDYLNVSRIESGNMKYNLSDFNLKDKVEELCDDLRPIALKKGLILLFRTDIKSRAVVHADVGKTVQIIHNLINNSIKYTQRGSISVFMRDDIKQKKIFVEISDTGVGMSQETIHVLFQKFSRAKNANTVNVSGTGLGLFVAHKMAEAMNGDITAYSEGEGKGSRFTLELPLAL